MARWIVEIFFAPLILLLKTTLFYSLAHFALIIIMKGFFCIVCCTEWRLVWVQSNLHFLMLSVNKTASISYRASLKYSNRTYNCTHKTVIFNFKELMFYINDGWITKGLLLCSPHFVLQYRKVYMHAHYP